MIMVVVNVVAMTSAKVEVTAVLIGCCSDATSNQWILIHCMYNHYGHNGLYLTVLLVCIIFW